MVTLLTGCSEFETKMEEMNRIEKVLQNDDSAYIYFIKLIKTFIVFISFYLFSILEKN